MRQIHILYQMIESQIEDEKEKQHLIAEADAQSAWLEKVEPTVYPVWISLELFNFRRASRGYVALKVDVVMNQIISGHRFVYCLALEHPIDIRNEITQSILIFDQLKGLLYRPEGVMSIYMARASQEEDENDEVSDEEADRLHHLFRDIDISDSDSDRRV